MTIRRQVINKLLVEDKLKEYDTISLGNINFHLKYGTDIIKHNEVPTLTTKCEVAVVVKE